MSRSYKDGQKWRGEKAIRRDMQRSRWKDGLEYPWKWRGRIFATFDEYSDWYIRFYTRGTWPSPVGYPQRDAPKCYKKAKCRCCNYAGTKRWWYKNRTARLNRLVAKDDIRHELFKMLHDK